MSGCSTPIAERAYVLTSLGKDGARVFFMFHHIAFSLNRFLEWLEHLYAYRFCFD